MLAKILGKKVMFYGNGYGPINKKVSEVFIRSLISKVDLITVRDEISKAELNKLGIVDNVVLTSDPTFTMKPCDSNRVKEIFLEEGIPIDKDLVGISVRRWKNDEKIKEGIIEAIKHLEDKGMEVVLIPMKYPDDLDFSSEIRAESAGSPYVIKNYYKPKEILGIIGKMTMMVGIRLHALIFSAIVEVPMVGIEYDPKVKGFLKVVNQESAGDISYIDGKKLCDTIDKVCNNREKYIGILEDKKVTLEKKSLENAELAVKLLLE